MIDLQKGDCLELMNKNIKDKSVDLILCDLPYGTTNHKWDFVIPFDKMWEQYNRIIKDHGAIVLFGAEPFSTKLRMSNLDMYRYDWVWLKSRATLFQMSHKRPMNKHELVSVFYKHLPTYNPQMSKGKPYKDKGHGKRKSSGFLSSSMKNIPTINHGTRFPTTILNFPNSNNKRYHPTEKPLNILEYLIKTYTNEGDLVLDNCMGSGSTGVAAKRLKRDFIGYELNGHYFDVAKERINNESAD
ncbi:DNA-methyltransferase [Apilactobacillus timberlakei]|uniref:DNA-methyltransferase n=1 Tax=Apilactobacillus timberlakei TaxID=2008380 RepID=UPI001CDD1C33|nr:site-specific DNA-methyltransferase [Apilactobacillus timberlakei]